MNDYHKLASTYASLVQDAKKYPLGGFSAGISEKPAPRDDAPVAAIFAPHPDDEVIVGALPYRLSRQCGWKVVDVPVTLGSKVERREERLSELKSCLQYIGFALHSVADNGLDSINLKGREDIQHWLQAVDAIAKVIASLKPRVIFFPHSGDWNATHIGTHFLLMDALKTMPAEFACYVVETEYWAALEHPNLMVEVSEQMLGDLLTALSFHKGELMRNPYHVGLPAWMIDNVRRGSELLAGKGATASSATFSVLYRVRRYANGEMLDVLSTNKVLTLSDDPAALFPV
jgi:LmbE family N-acetylglucosaminyl deacetylase